MGLFARRSHHVEAVALDRHLAGSESHAAEFGEERLTHASFASGDRLDIHQPARQGDDVHGERINYPGGHP